MCDPDTSKYILYVHIIYYHLSFLYQSLSGDNVKKKKKKKKTKVTSEDRQVHWMALLWSYFVPIYYIS